MLVAVWSELLMWQEMIDWVAMGRCLRVVRDHVVSAMSAGLSRLIFDMTVFDLTAFLNWAGNRSHARAEWSEQ